MTNRLTTAFAALAMLVSGIVYPAGQQTKAAQLMGGTAEPAVIQIDAGGSSATTQRLALGLNKAAIVELPVDAADVLISNPEVADAVVRTARRTYVIGMAVGETNAFFFDSKGEQILNLEIHVERDLDQLLSVIGRHVPDGRIEVEAINDNIVLSGTVESAAASNKARDIAARFIGDEEKVLNMLAIEGHEQVLLKVTIAEMQRSLIKQLGIDLSAVTSIGDLALRLATSNNFSVSGNLGGLTTAPSGSDSSTGFTFDDGDSVDAAVQALERTGLLRTLAEPNLTAISGESANFLVGGEFPVPADRDRNGNVKIEFKPFGVGLAFTPVVMSGGRISMKISTEVSELSSDGAYVAQGYSGTDSDGNIVSINGVTVPALRVRRAETTVELPSGGSLALAGLLQESTRQSIDGVPGAKDIPILGSLFRSNDYLNSETELVVLVTPYLVEPVKEKDIALPTDGFAPASDSDTYLFGKLNATYGADSKRAQAAVNGPVGFIME